MPAKNALKTYLPNTYYHIYNRGVEKRTIFQTEKDYKIFLSYLKFYLTPPAKNLSPKSPLPSFLFTPPSKALKNYANDISLIAYCLMPNHFHFLIHQKTVEAMNHFMRSFITRYVRCFNKRYNRVGPLFQGCYKAVAIESENQLTYVTRYIHRNCLDLFPPLPARRVLAGYPHSSYYNYVGTVHQTWVNPQPILQLFSSQNSPNSYLGFVSDSLDYPQEISHWALDAL